MSEEEQKAKVMLDQIAQSIQKPLNQFVGDSTNNITWGLVKKEVDLFLLALLEKDQKLISYLAKHNHWSPFAHTALQFRIKAPIFVARQMVKHQVGGVWNEVSRRYVDDEPEFYFPDVWRGKPVNAKQGSSEVVVKAQLGVDGHDGEVFYDPQQACQLMLELYQNMLYDGVAPEQARMMLPQNMMTEWWWTGSLYFFTRVCNLRLDPHAQQETREVAEQIRDILQEHFPVSFNALMEN